MSSVSFIAATQPSVSVTAGKSTAQQTAATQPQSSPNASSSVTISRAAQAVSQASSSSAASSGSYDFTNMTPNEMGKLVGDGKITGGFFTITPAQLRIAGEMASGMQVSQSEIDAANSTPANYIQLLTKGIQDSKMFGIDTTGLESILRQMEALQGTPATTTST